jgi:PTH1 family peptidyl-tRNA hydrolase
VNGDCAGAAGMKAIVGLGNPGSSYARTRHNVGFWVVDRLAERHCLRFSRREYKSQMAEGRIGEEEVVLLKPQTFMNASGEAVGRARRGLRLDPAEFVIVYDDLDLELGRVRVRTNSGAGGHHGVESVIEALGSKVFPRVRVGVGRPSGGDPIEYLLEPPSPEDAQVLRASVEQAADAVEAVLGEGVVPAMNRFNRRPAG